MEKTLEDFICRHCKGTGKFIPKGDTRIYQCSFCNGGSGFNDPAIAAYFRDKLEDALAGVRIVGELRDGESDVYLSEVRGIEKSLYGFGDKFRVSIDDVVTDFDSPLEAITKLLS